MKGPGPRSSSWRRVDALVREELRDYRRNRFVLGTMTAMALLFITMPSVCPPTRWSASASRAFMGWFGPRGVASIVFGITRRRRRPNRRS